MHVKHLACAPQPRKCVTHRLPFWCTRRPLLPQIHTHSFTHSTLIHYFLQTSTHTHTHTHTQCLGEQCRQWWQITMSSPWTIIIIMAALGHEKIVHLRVSS